MSYRTVSNTAVLHSSTRCRGNKLATFIVAINSGKSERILILIRWLLQNKRIKIIQTSQSNKWIWRSFERTLTADKTRSTIGIFSYRTWIFYTTLKVLDYSITSIRLRELEWWTYHVAKYLYWWYYWLLQPCTSCTASATVNHWAVTTCAERSCSTCLRSTVSPPHHSGAGAVTLAAGAVPHQIQTMPADAPDSRRAMPGISRWTGELVSRKLSSI